MPIRIIGDVDNKRSDKWISSVLKGLEGHPSGEVTSVFAQLVKKFPTFSAELESWS